MPKEIKRIDIKEFREVGFLQEVNRAFLHPLGLALEVVINEDGSEALGGVWDYRDDPEGMCFGNAVDEDKIAAVDAERERHAAARIELFGGTVIQPEGWSLPHA